MVINRTKFDVCTCSSFGGVKASVHTDRIAVYILYGGINDGNDILPTPQRSGVVLQLCHRLSFTKTCFWLFLDN